MDLRALRMFPRGDFCWGQLTHTAREAGCGVGNMVRRVDGGMTRKIASVSAGDLFLWSARCNDSQDLRGLVQGLTSGFKNENTKVVVYMETSQLPTSRIIGATKRRRETVS